MNPIHPITTSIFRRSKKIVAPLIVSYLLVAQHAATGDGNQHRVKLAAPTIEIRLDGTESDYIEYDETLEPRQIDSGASYTVDAEMGTYHFTFKSPDSVGYERAEWTPRSLVESIAFATVTRNDGENTFRYAYSLSNLDSSKHAVRSFLIRTPTNGTSIGGSEELQTKRIAREGGIGVDLIWRLKDDGITAIGVAPGEKMQGMWIESMASPAIVLCGAEGLVAVMKTTTALPGSIEGAVQSYLGFFEDCVKGVTVGPGHAEPTLAQLRSYLPICRSQGWGSKGVCDRIEERILKCEEEIAKDPNGKRASLKRLYEYVEEVTRGDYKKLTPELDALIRLNIYVMMELAAPKVDRKLK